MAFLGAQLVITLIMSSFLQKLMPYLSLSSWILCKRLVRYLHPSDEHLKEASGKSHTSGNKKGRKENQSNSGSGFNVSRNIDIQLEVAKIQPADIIHLHYYPDFHWLLDFSFSTIIVYGLTEIYCYWSSVAKNEINLSMLWSLLGIIFALKILCSLTAIYFKNEATQGERSMTLVCGSSFFLLAMIVLIADEKILEFGLIKAHESLSERAGIFLTNYGVNATGSSSKLTFKFVLAIWSGLIGALFTFPGMRGAKMHIDSLKYTEGSYFIRTILHLNVLSMIVVSLLWVKPIARDCLTTLKCSNSLEKPLMDDETFNTLRIYIVLSMLGLRLLLTTQFLQSYLNIAYDKMIQLKKEAGKINSIDLQRMIARVFYYLCVVALQYIAPIFICLYLTLMLKTLGGYVWHPSFIEPEIPDDNSNSTRFSFVFSTMFYRGILNYATWWCCTTLSLTNGLGFIYYSYFSSN